MPEELQHLLQRIRTEAVETSESEAEEILSRARHQAATLVGEAEARAKSLIRDAELDAQVYTERSTRALEQAGRDLLITIGQGIQKTLNQMIGSAVQESFSPTFLQEQIGKLITSWLEQADTNGIEVRVHPADEEAIRTYLQAQFQTALSNGLVVRGDAGVTKGFRISYDGTNAFHDFTASSISDALSALIRPHLADIIHRVARETGDGARVEP